MVVIFNTAYAYGDKTGRHFGNQCSYWNDTNSLELGHTNPYRRNVNFTLLGLLLVMHESGLRTI